jgi:hypothetical protein
MEAAMIRMVQMVGRRLSDVHLESCFLILLMGLRLHLFRQFNDRLKVHIGLVILLKYEL